MNPLVYLGLWLGLHGWAVYFHYTMAKAVYAWGERVGATSLQPLPDAFQEGPHPKSYLWRVAYWPLAICQFSIFLVPSLVLALAALWHGSVLQTYCLAAACHVPLLVLRAISFRLTLLPDITQEFKRPRPLHGATYDLIFSGHTVFALVPTYLLIWMGWLPLWSTILLLLVNLLNAWGIVFFRRHYSVDVWLALVIGTLVTYWVLTFPPYRATWCFTENFQ